MYAGATREKAIEDIVQGSNFILIAGKTLLTRESDFSNLLGASWKLIFVDEYHEFKNSKSQSFKCLEQIRDDMNCPIVGMTGTLMQVRLNVTPFIPSYLMLLTAFCVAQLPF